MDYWFKSLEKFGINLGLDRIIYLLDKLGNPHQKFKSIHIAGTNGKGSTAAMLASILKEAGYKVGLYTSPHLFDYRERIKINGKDISKKDFQEGSRRVKKVAKGMRGRRGQPTIFEVLTAVAFWHFAKKRVDYAIVEVGMGGRLDATNVLNPLVSIITNISYEHTKVLGKTLAKIAGEKAAIIKPCVPVITAEDKAEPLGVIEKACRKNGSLLFEVGKKKKAVSRKQLAVSGKLLGEHQKVNAMCALSALLLADIKVSKSAIRRGLQEVDWPGRFQILSKKPLIIVDGAHNPAGMNALRVTIEEMFPQKFAVIFGCQKDKDYKKMLKELNPITKETIFTRSSHKQAAKLRNSVPLKKALSEWDRVAPLLITGSLFLVADALKRL